MSRSQSCPLHLSLGQDRRAHQVTIRSGPREKASMAQHKHAESKPFSLIDLSKKSCRCSSPGYTRCTTFHCSFLTTCSSVLCSTRYLSYKYTDATVTAYPSVPGLPHHHMLVRPGRHSTVEDRKRIFHGSRPPKHHPFLSALSSCNNPHQTISNFSLLGVL